MIEIVRVVHMETVALSRHSVLFTDLVRVTLTQRNTVPRAYGGS
jgi:hypothetical protein